VTLLAFAIGVVAGIAIGLALGAKWRNDLREKLRISEARLDAYNLNALATDHDVAGVATPPSNVELYDQDSADFYGIHSELPRQPLPMTGERDVEAQDRELVDIYDFVPNDDDNPDFTGWADGVHRADDDESDVRALPSPRVSD
jgi:hypothetical protein